MVDLSISTNSDNYKDFKFEYELNTKEYPTSMVKQVIKDLKGTDTEITIDDRFAGFAASNMTYILFNINETLDIFEQDYIPEVGENTHLILDKIILDSELSTQTEWSIPIINNTSWEFLNYVRQKRPDVIIKNVMFFKPVFISDLSKIYDYNYIDVTKFTNINLARISFT